MINRIYHCLSRNEQDILVTFFKILLVHYCWNCVKINSNNLVKNFNISN